MPDIDEVKSARSNLEAAIRDVINEFEADTGVQISWLHLDRGNETVASAGDKRQLESVSIEIIL